MKNERIRKCQTISLMKKAAILPDGRLSEFPQAVFSLVFAFRSRICHIAHSGPAMHTVE
jgi:hypothetical protein